MPLCRQSRQRVIIKYIPLQQGLRLITEKELFPILPIIKYIPLQQGLRHKPTFELLNLLQLLSIFHYNKD